MRLVSSIKFVEILFCGENDVLLNSKETIIRVSEFVPNATVNLLSGHGHVLIGLKSKIIEFLIK